MGAADRARRFARQGLMWVSVGAAAPAAHDVRDSLRLPQDIVYTRTTTQRPVPFSHVTHFEYAKQSCVVCHPQPFSMLRPTHRVTHRAMDHRAQCGVCHDGVKAASTRDSTSCVECHIPPAAPATVLAASDDSSTTHGPRTPSDIRLPRSGDSPGPVVFRHGTHRGRAGTCASCHPVLFARKAGSVRSATAHDGAQCGQCHDGSKSFGVDDDAQCAKCHAGAGS